MFHYLFIHLNLLQNTQEPLEPYAVHIPTYLIGNRFESLWDMKGSFWPSRPTVIVLLCHRIQKPRNSLLSTIPGVKASAWCGPLSIKRITDFVFFHPPITIS